MSTTTLSNAKKNLDSLLDEAVRGDEPVVIRRAGKPDVALVPTALLKEKSKKTHSAHLFQSKKARTELVKAAADFDAGRNIGWTGTSEEFEAMTAQLLKGKSRKPKSRR